MAGNQNGRDLGPEKALREEMMSALRNGLFGAGSEGLGFNVTLARPGSDYCDAPGSFPWRYVAVYTGPRDYQTPTDGSSRGVRWQSEVGDTNHMFLHVSMATPVKDRWWLKAEDAVRRIVDPVLDRAGLGRESLQMGGVSTTDDYREETAGVNIGFYICPPRNHRTTSQWDAYRTQPNL